MSSWTSDSGVFPEEMGSYHEGDILFLEEKRNGIIDRNYRWPGGVVYYRIDARFSESEINQLPSIELTLKNPRFSRSQKNSERHGGVPQVHMRQV